MKKIYKIKVNGKAYEVELQEISSVQGEIKAETIGQSTPISIATGGESVTAPMPGVIIDIKVSKGDSVAKDQLVAVLEAMKMETEIFAPNAGTITAVNVEKGAQVNLGDTIVSLG
ncbi:biotin/lipoyl-containing protein [Psychrilyobacter sp.]|uniref:biotin/lipoyl-containing protein n=1 Tax=Psychrilyobacter sp. TaxID=2586924 RepID=UPI0030180318